MSEIETLRAQVAAFTTTLQQQEHAAQQRIAAANAERDKAAKAEALATAKVKLAEALAMLGGDGAAIALIPDAEASRLLVDGKPAPRETMMTIASGWQQSAPQMFHNSYVPKKEFTTQ